VGLGKAQGFAFAVNFKKTGLRERQTHSKISAAKKQRVQK
jgi:hypothetical protein